MGHQLSLLNLLVMGGLVIATWVAGTKAFRALKEMLATGVAYPLFDWRELFGPRRQYPKAENPVIFSLLVFVAACFTTILLAMAIVIGFFLATCVFSWILRGARS